jgi:hypothetical protein
MLLAEANCFDVAFDDLESLNTQLVLAAFFSSRMRGHNAFAAVRRRKYLNVLLLANGEQSPPD